MNERGKVYLTGAGPGAADLLTVRAARVLARAEIVFHDALVSDEVLRLCPSDCQIVSVGKKCGTPSHQRQEQIHQLLDEASQRYQTVVRLKGGDPCVFGRGGEELEYLTARQIPWEVIPGISAGIGGLSALGLPLTHRSLSSGVTLLTGSQALTGTFEGIPGLSALSPQLTFVFYMGFQHVAAIAEDLLLHGMPPATYALCASRLTCSDQRVLTAPLDRIGAEVAGSALQTPALLVVGDVVAFWKDLVEQADAGRRQ
jgi:uroporphyrin-III C-methyltransferase